MRRSLVTAAVVLGCLLGAMVASGEFSIQPLARWFSDDRTLDFGNTPAAPDVSCQWETADASDHHLECNQNNTGADFVVAFDQNVDWGVVNSGRLRVHSQDSASPLEWIGLRHDGTNPILENGSGTMFFDSVGDAFQIGDSAEASTTVRMWAAGGVGQFAEYAFRSEAGAATDGLVLRVEGNLDQAVVGLDAVAGNQLVIGARAQRDRDFDQADQTNPTLYVFSNLNPDVNNTQWASLAHDQTNPVLAWGLGMLTLSPPAGDESVRLPTIDAAVPAEPHACDATHTGAMVWVNDSDDTLAAQVCVCSKDNDVPTYDWNQAGGGDCAFF